MADSCADGVKSASGPQGESAVILPPVSETEKRQWDLEELRKQGLARPRFEWQDHERLAVVADAVFDADGKGIDALPRTTHSLCAPWVC
jgi:hypothetical protein